MVDTPQQIGYYITMILTLKGLSQKGKNRVRENKTQWIVEQETETRFLIRAIEGDDFRWISRTNDKDFEIIEVSE